MAAQVPQVADGQATWFGETAAMFRAIRAEDPKLTDTKLLLLAAVKVGTAYDFIFSPGGMVSNVLGSDLRTQMKGVTDYDKLKAHSIRFVEELCKDEVKTKGLKPVRGDKYSGLVCLVWLLRHLMFVTTFIKYLVELEPATPGECARRTYEEVLKPYHGFMIGGVVSAAMALAPHRDTLYKNMGLGQAVSEAKLKEEIGIFLRDAMPVVGQLKAWLDENEWYFPDKA